MRIRPASVADREAIIAIDHLAKQRLAFLDRILRSATCLVVERDGRVVGYAALEHTFFEQGFISMVYVAETARRRGVGRTLVQALSARCETRKLFSSTNQSNTPMQQLLTGLGFVASGMISNLDPGDDELVYFLDCGSSGPR